MSIQLKPIISLKNVIAQNPNGCVPISDVSKKGLHFDVKIKVARFLRQYPSIFEEFTGPQYNLPWFRLTREAVEIDREERKLYENCKEDLRERLKKFILMSKQKVLPLKVIQGMLWYLGLPEDFLECLDMNLDGSFRVVEMEEGLKGLAVESNERIFGVRLRRKIEVWLKEFQQVPYVSPYEEYSHLDPNSDIAEKRVAGFLHELLCLFVEHSAERRRLLCLKKYFGLPQKVHKAFERHPYMFYLSLRNKTCTAILKEAYCDKMAIERHPVLRIRNKYINLMKESESITNYLNRLALRGYRNSSYSTEVAELVNDQYLQTVQIATVLQEETGQL
ncbi:hypothetical protein OIU76_013072 [Salix suchowensis]|nr:hypothetical protein OIU76_013072 [Salix suchowensis]